WIIRERQPVARLTTRMSMHVVCCTPIVPASGLDPGRMFSAWRAAGSRSSDDGAGAGRWQRAPGHGGGVLAMGTPGMVHRFADCLPGASLHTRCAVASIAASDRALRL